MEQTIEELFTREDLIGCTVDYYPHIVKQYENGGTLKNENNVSINCKPTRIICDTATEYVYGWMKMIIHDDHTREYLSSMCKDHKITDGLYIVSKIDCIDPNKFPILCKYYDISTKISKIYYDKYVTLQIINEQWCDGKNEQKNNATYIKISFQIENGEQYKRGVIRHIKEVISLLQYN